MERGRFFEYDPNPAEDFSREIERRLKIPRFELESNVERGVETLFHTETNTLLIVPPTPKRITPADLAEMSVPVVKYIYDEQPDMVVGCDRGGRLFSLAVHSTWQRLANKLGRFPTEDSRLHFARLSKSVSTEDFDDTLHQVIMTSTLEGARQQTVQNGEIPHFMFIDDWIASGATRALIKGTLKSFGMEVKTSFAVMCGSGGNVTGSQNSGFVDWSDNEKKIGIAYDGVKPTPVRSEESRQIRKEIYTATKRFK